MTKNIEVIIKKLIQFLDEYLIPNQKDTNENIFLKFG